jgi:hypothetical protein
LLQVFATRALNAWLDPKFISASPSPTRPDPRARTFLIIMTVAPFGVAAGLALLAGSGLRQDWLAPMLCLIPALLVDWLVRVSDDVMKRLQLFAVVALALPPMFYCGVLFSDQHSPHRKMMRVNWPQSAIERELGGAWSVATGRPLKIVCGSAWIAGLVGLNNPDAPSILFNGDLTRSLWITPDRITREGMLVVWVEGIEPETKDMMELAKSYPVHSIRIPLPRSRQDTAITVSYVIVPPRS